MNKKLEDYMRRNFVDHKYEPTVTYGAIIGDVVGSRFEFDRGGKTKIFKLFTPDSVFTDDTMMTLAVAYAVMGVSKDATELEIKDSAIKCMRLFGRICPNAGYGARFVKWLFSKDPKPYWSFGNGSAMRTSAIGWRYDSLERTEQVAKWVAEVSHNHPEGIKGAQCTSAVIYLARTGHTKDEIVKYAVSKYGYDISETLDEMRARHEHVETCMDSMPKALKSFHEGSSYEDVVRNAVSLGGDTDTIGAIAGSMASAYYGVPKDIINECDEVLPKWAVDIIHDLESKYLTN